MILKLTQKRPVHLILDDISLQVQLIEILEKFTKNIKSFNNAEEFLSEPLAKAPVCLITELSIPETDGITLIKLIREQGLSTPIIVIANKNDGVYSAVQAIRAGANDFIERPIVERDFIERVNNVLIRELE